MSNLAVVYHFKGSRQQTERLEERQGSSKDDGKGGLSLRGVAVMSTTATTAETVKTVTVASWHCIFL